MPIGSPPPTNSSSSIVEEQSERESLDTQQTILKEIDNSPKVLNLQRPKRTIVKPAHYKDKNFISTFSCFFTSLIDDEEPFTFEQAKGNKEWEFAWMLK